jgi:hypothetical protein
MRVLAALVGANPAGQGASLELSSQHCSFEPVRRRANAPLTAHTSAQARAAACPWKTKSK